MPILDIEIVLRPQESLKNNLAANIANRAGQIFSSPPGTTWVKLKTIASHRYAENESLQSDAVYPVFVSILKAKQPTLEQMAREVTLLTAVLAQLCDRPQENIHLYYFPEGSGRIAFGGQILSDP